MREVIGQKNPKLLLRDKIENPKLLLRDKIKKRLAITTSEHKEYEKKL